MYERILIPTDGSEGTDTVVEEAASLVDPENVHVHVLYVIDHRALLPLGEDEQRTVGETLQERGEAAVESVSEAITEALPDAEVTTMVAQGLPARQILAYVQEKGVDAVFLGSHGQTMRKQAIGSTTERVVRGINHIPETSVIIIPIGRPEERPGPEEAITEQAKEMFQ
ncbi:MAG: universal stress protein [Halodesulfurarchaeum sp.]